MKVRQRRREESLERLEERLEKGWELEDEDQEAALDELIEAMVPTERAGAPPEPGLRRGDEFTCARCHLIRPRRCLADEAGMVCEDCVAEERVPEPPVPHHRREESPCPACGSVVMVPERDDAACGFFCPECGAHVTRRGGRLHLVWNHRYRPDHLVLPGGPGER